MKVGVALDGDIHTSYVADEAGVVNKGNRAEAGVQYQVVHKAEVAGEAHKAHDARRIGAVVCSWLAVWYRRTRSKARRGCSVGSDWLCRGKYM